MQTPLNELQKRWQNCLTLLKQHIPQASGIFIFSRITLYYFTGTFANGLLWLPIKGEPTLFCKKGIERARIESPISNIFAFNSYADVSKILHDLHTQNPDTVAADMGGLSWALANSFQKHFANWKIISADKIVSMTRAKKSEMELAILREAGRRHCLCLTEKLPSQIHINMSEFEIARILSDIFFSEKHHGIMRMSNLADEVFLGHVCVGENGNFPSAFDGPVGIKGVHPATPVMGYDDTKWLPHQILTVDAGFNLNGYHTDKTQIYWSGTKETIPDAVKKAHECCIEVQEMIANALTPGAVPSALWQECLDLVKNKGFHEGFMGIGGNKVRFVGHGIGLAIDEYPVIAKGFDIPIEQGMAIALEPKIGIKGVGMVGVENTFEVTEKGGISLTGDNFDIICLSD